MRKHNAMRFLSGVGVERNRLGGGRLGRAFRGGLVFKAHRLLYHSTLGVRVMKKKKKTQRNAFLDGVGG